MTICSVSSELPGDPCTLGLVDRYVWEGSSGSMGVGTPARGQRIARVLASAAGG
jgi:hypothetical protein